jgi:hypothetical protein
LGRCYLVAMSESRLRRRGVPEPELRAPSRFRLGRPKHRRLRSARRQQVCAADRAVVPCSSTPSSCRRGCSASRAAPRAPLGRSFPVATATGGRGGDRWLQPRPPRRPDSTIIQAGNGEVSSRFAIRDPSDCTHASRLKASALSPGPPTQLAPPSHLSVYRRRHCSQRDYGSSPRRFPCRRCPALAPRRSDRPYDRGPC